MRAWWWRRCFVAAVATAFGICPAAQADDATQRGERAASEQAAEEIRAAQAAKAAFHPSHLRSSVATMSATRVNPAATSHVWQARKAARPPPAIIPRIAFSEATGESSETYFDEHIDGIIQGQCIACHVDGGASANTRIVFVAGSDASSRRSNRQTLADFLSLVEGGAELLLNKVQGVSHGGGVQLQAGSSGFEHMRTWLGLVGEEAIAPGVTPETLFDSVRMVSHERTLRRAALLFAGRNPTAEELRTLAEGTVGVRRAIRDLMQGPAFHEFLIRAGNDRLFTDRHIRSVLDPNSEYFVRLAQLMRKGRVRYGDDFYGSKWFRAVQFGVARAPLELIAHVVENDLPYTEILTADYIMANPFAAEIYDAPTEFLDDDDPFEFQPSAIVGYYGKHESKITRFNQRYGLHVISPGTLRMDIPLAGVLNTNVFLHRYPSTATNRNRARARWTYYHFLGVDVEKSASRTTDPAALADTNNPTMHNSACTVCHAALDPVAGAFQNYGNEGYYRENYGGTDSLDEFYKEPPDGSETLYVEGDTWYRDMRVPGFEGAVAPDADYSLQWLASRITEDERFAEAAVRFWWPAVMGTEMAEAPEDPGDVGFAGRLLAANAQALEMTRLAERFRQGIGSKHPYNVKNLLTDLVLSKWFRAGAVTDDDPTRREALRNAGAERLLTPEELTRKTAAVTGVEWGRIRPNTNLRFVHNSSHLERDYHLLYGGIDSAGVTERAPDMTALMASVAQRQALELSRMIVLKELYLLPRAERRLFGSVDVRRSPAAELGRVSSVRGLRDSPQTLAVSGAMKRGAKTVTLAFLNGTWDGEQRKGRHLWVDRIALKDSAGALVANVELEELSNYTTSHNGNCGHFTDNGYQFHGCEGALLRFPVTIAADGDYRLEVVAWGERFGDQLPRLAVSVDGDRISARQASRIKVQLAALHWHLLGEQVGTDSADVKEAYALFTDVWRQHYDLTSGSRLCDWPAGRCLLNVDQAFFEGIVEEQPLKGNAQGWRWVDWRQAEEIIGATPDPFHVAQSWAVVLAFLMTDYRYLHL
ncbi:MAG: DUF1588 domain-containing protein [Gammaproteobacteria bacterium]|nr:DUF1588 domain-containing protein [Gammaproteobacteria bacterium]